MNATRGNILGYAIACQDIIYILFSTESPVAASDFSTQSIHITLARLIELKSKRDQTKFTSSQLAKALNVPRSLLSRLLHSDPNKRVTNPTIETLIHIIDFFRSDGFDVTLDDLLGITDKLIDVQEQPTDRFLTKVDVPLYSLDDINSGKIGEVTLNLADHYDDVVAYYSHKDIKPIFKAGSIFIVDTKVKPEDQMLVAIQWENEPNIRIRKYICKKSKILLQSHDSNEETLLLSSTTSCKMLGVVIQINAKT